MAKKVTMPKLMQRTETAGNQPATPAMDLDAGVIKAVSTGLKQGEIAALDAIAEANDLARNAVMRFAIRKFLIDYRDGRVDLSGAFEVETKRRFKLPK